MKNSKTSIKEFNMEIQCKTSKEISGMGLP
jgi:hypothetical protein